jgi:hypothetical protein
LTPWRGSRQPIRSSKILVILSQAKDLVRLEVRKPP